MTLFYTAVGLAGAGGLALAAWLAASLRRERILPRVLRSDVPDLVRLGKIEEARARCRQNRSALGAVWSVTLERLARDRRTGPDLLAAVEGERARQEAMVRARASYLLDIGNGALLAGLFGGICAAAQALEPSGFDALAAAPEALASLLAGLAASAGTGLGVSLFALLAFAVYRARGVQALDELAELSTGLLPLLEKQPITHNE